MKIYKIILILLFTFGSLAAQEKELLFENITTLDGLSTSRIKCVFQDSYGYLWFGTLSGGLDRYDGNTFQNYSHDSNDSLGIISNNIYDIAEDTESNLWIATDFGISQYNRKEDNFINYNLFDDFENLTDNRVWTVFIDSKNRIWFGTNHLGALVYDKETNRFIPMGQDTENINDYSNKNFSDFTEDHNGVIWGASASNGLFWYDEKNNKFIYVSLKLPANGLSDLQRVFRVFPDSENALWVMTPTDLFKYFPSSQKSIHLMNYEISSPINGGFEGAIWEDSHKNMWVVHINIPHPIKFPNLSNEYFEINSERMKPSDIYIDTFGTIWVSDWSKGLFKLVPARQQFHHLQSEINEQLTLNAQFIRPLCQSAVDSNIVYFGLDVPGLVAFNKLTKIYSHIRKNQTIYISESKAFSNNDGTVWIAFWNQGIALWNPKTDKITPYFSSSSNTPNLSITNVTQFSEAPDGSLWIGTFNGLFHLSADKTRLDSIPVTNRVNAICQDKNFLWLGTRGEGLLKYDINTKKILSIKIDGLSNSNGENVRDIYKDNKDYLWLATNGGLIKFDPKLEKFEIFGVPDGLSNESIVAILPDDSGDLWMSTRGGISRLHMDSEGSPNFKNYDERDGLYFSNFRYPFKLKDDKGTLYFGGEGGTYYLTPKKEKSIAPRIHLTDIAINGNQVSKNYSHEINNGYSIIELRYDQNTISLGFTGIHTGESNKYRYAHYHYLEGYDYEWNYSSESQVQYLNLVPGTYKFHFKAVNRAGVWNEKQSVLDIIIFPPWWQTWWAYLSYVFIGLGFLYTIRSFELNRQKKNAAINESILRAESAEFQVKAAEAQSKVIQAENDRKTEELEEARKLQLSLLPKDLPNIENLDIAVYMKTATEVGGDYYDFSTKEDGSLNICLGDATGHGMKAGTLVLMIKSIFTVDSTKVEINDFFISANSGLKRMALGKMMMAFGMININGNRVKFCNAGIPPFYIYRKEKQLIEEIKVNGLPLGAMKNSKYEIYEGELSKGDVILMLSDGFPELQNDKEEMYGYDRLLSSFGKVSNKSSKEIINYLKDEGSKWVNDKDPDDDVTFVVIKVK